MPVQTAGQKPTIAIITSKYYEKLAVDAMMEDKTTFVKYKTEGGCSATGTAVFYTALITLYSGVDQILSHFH